MANLGQTQCNTNSRIILCSSHWHRHHAFCMFLRSSSLSRSNLLQKKNIYILAICTSNISVAVYAALRYTRLEGAIHLVRSSSDGMGDHLADISRDIWIYIRPAELAVPIMLGFGTLGHVPASYRLHKDYAWAIYKHIHGNTELRLRYVTYKVLPSDAIPCDLAKI